jgi:hypothetical protein
VGFVLFVPKLHLVAVAELGQGASSFVTGSIHVVDGGETVD